MTLKKLLALGLAAWIGNAAVDVNKIAYAQQPSQNIIYVDDDSVNGDGSRTRTMYGSSRNVEEDGGWKRVKNVRSKDL